MWDLLVTFVWTVLIVTILLIAATGLVLWMGVRKYRRRNRFGKNDRYVAPTYWLWGPGEAPRLHRRLLDAVRGARAAADRYELGRVTDSGLVRLVDELEAQADRVDDGIIAVSRRGRGQKAEELKSLRSGVAEVEAVSARIVRMADDAVERGFSADLGKIQDRLDALEHAHREIRELG